MKLTTLLLLAALSSPGLAQTSLVGAGPTGAGGTAGSGMYAMTGSAGQAAPPGSSAAGSYTLGSGLLSWSDYGTSSVSVMHSVVSTAAAAQPITITSSFLGGSSRTTMCLHYRRGGDPAFIALPMTAGGAAAQAIIPADAVTPRGVEYLITAHDSANGAHARVPYLGYHCIQVSSADPGLQLPAALPAGKYRLISLPVVAENPGANILLVNALGAYDNTKWRLFELPSSQHYSEYPAVGSMLPGKAFWLVTKSGGTFTTGAAKSNPTKAQFAVPLNPGWTLVGDPFYFTVPVAKLSRKSGDVIDVRRWVDAWQVETGSLEPFSGYAVANGNAAVDTLFFNPDQSTGALPRIAGSAARSAAAWGIGITASSGTALDSDNELLVSASASRSLDSLDRPEAPQIGDYVSLYFNHPEWHAVFSRYCTDARPLPTEGETWEFEVTTVTGRRVDLRFSGLESVPAAFDAWVVDLDLKLSADLRASGAYGFTSRGEGSARRFSLIVGNHAYAQAQLGAAGAVPHQYMLSQNYPNPFNPLTVIQYGLPSRSHVLLELFDLLGRKVATLLDDDQQEGMRSREFDGRGLASGVYLYRLTATPLNGGNRFCVTRKMTLVK